MLSPEQTLQFQLEVSETLTRVTTRDGIGLALAEVINKVVPFEFFLHSIWMPGATSGYRISSVKNPEGKFEVFHDVELENYRNSNFESFVDTGSFLSNPDNEGIYQGENLLALNKRYPVFAIGHQHGIRSIMIFNMLHENGAKHTMVISSLKENAFVDSQFKTVKTAFPQIKMAFENLFNYEGLKKQERDLALQLEVNNMLVKFRTRDELCLMLNTAIDKVVPFDMGFVRIWNDPGQLGFFRGYSKDGQGVFQLMEENPFVKLASEDSETVKVSGERFAQKPQVFQGDDFQKICEVDTSFKMARDVLHIRSVLSMHVTHEVSVVQFTLTSRNENAFTEDQLQAIIMLQPQLRLAIDNVFNYEIIQHKELERSLQLELNNILLGHTDRESFAVALAQVINKMVPCERFIMRVWNGPIQAGYRIPLKRNSDGAFNRFSDLAVAEFAERNPDIMLKGSAFIASNPAIFQGDSFTRLAEQFPMAQSISDEFAMQSLMVLPFKTADTTCILALGNSATVSFTEAQFELMKMLLPQIILAFENLFKYEKLKQEERERKTQLELMTVFNVQGDLEEMALNAIGKMNDFIPFEYWMQISPIPTGQDLFFRLAWKEDGRFHGTAGAALFEKIKLEPLPIDTFMRDQHFLFEKLALYVGEDFDDLIARVPYFYALHQHLNLNSLAVFPITLMGKTDTILMMGSVRQYAFSLSDLEALNRIVPYISMAAQQYYSLFHIQRLTQQLEMEKNYLVEEIKSNYNFEEIIGTSHLMKEAFKKISQVAATDSTVLILGETGTGKELIARAIHNQSPRKDSVLVKVNCASLPSQLIESELFGHERGSFTGALEKRIGKFELAHGGTIFLDEIGELPLELQAKLLRVLQEREIERIGGKSTIALDVRIIAATNRDLETEVAEGRFRSDLYYRLNVFPIHLPPLRERAEDIPMLITHFFQKYSKKMKRPIRSIKDEVLQEMIHYEWPGNIRELENLIEQAVIVGDSNSIKLRRSVPRKSVAITHKKVNVPLPADNFKEEEIYRVLKMTKGKITGPEGAAVILDMRPSKIEEYERKWILDALQKTGGRIRGENGAAELIGVKPTTLEARVKKLKISKGEIFR